MADWAKWMFYATFLIGIVSVAVAIAGVFMVRRTLHLQRVATEAATAAVDQGRKALIADQRPWLTVEAECSAPITWTEYGGVHFPFRFKLINVGRTPALNADLHAEIVVTQNYRRLGERQINLAEKIRAGRPLDGAVVFPGHPVTQYNTLIVNGDEVAKPAATSSSYETPSDDLRPSLIGCVIYSSVFDNEIRETGFIYDLYRSSPDREGHSIGPSDGVIPAEELVIEPWVRGGRIT
jgi:hypothetical protein